MAPDACPPERVRAPCVCARHMDARYQGMLRSMSGQPASPKTKAMRAFGLAGPREQAEEEEEEEDDSQDAAICT